MTLKNVSGYKKPKGVWFNDIQKFLMMAILCIKAPLYSIILLEYTVAFV